MTSLTRNIFMSEALVHKFDHVDLSASSGETKS